MIFVSVGTLERPFDRLVENIDKIADRINEKILIQLGHSTYIPQKCEFFEFCSNEEMIKYISAASIIISHSGFGIIGNSIKWKKPLVLVPRELKYGEAIDRQYELAEYIAGQNESIICVRDITLLENAINKIRNIPVSYNYSTSIPNLIEDYISETFFRGR